MSPVIRISDKLFARLQAYAEPLKDTAEDVIGRILDDYDEWFRDNQEHRRDIKEEAEGSVPVAPKAGHEKQNSSDEKEGRMLGWTHGEVFDALVNRGHYHTKRNMNPYVCLTPTQSGKRGKHSMILYSPDCKSIRPLAKPFVYDDERDTFDTELLDRLEGGYIRDEEPETNQGKHWWHCKVTDWTRFAGALELDRK